MTTTPSIPEFLRHIQKANVIWILGNSTAGTYKGRAIMVQSFNDYAVWLADGQMLPMDVVSKSFMMYEA